VADLCAIVSSSCVFAYSCLLLLSSTEHLYLNRLAVMEEATCMFLKSSLNNKYCPVVVAHSSMGLGCATVMFRVNKLTLL
jgi:hypothetical protein